VKTHSIVLFDANLQDKREFSVNTDVFVEYCISSFPRNQIKNLQSANIIHRFAVEIINYD